MQFTLSQKQLELKEKIRAEELYMVILKLHQGNYSKDLVAFDSLEAFSEVKMARRLSTEKMMPKIGICSVT